MNQTTDEVALRLLAREARIESRGIGSSHLVVTIPRCDVPDLMRQLLAATNEDAREDFESQVSVFVIAPTLKRATHYVQTQPGMKGARPLAPERLQGLYNAKVIVLNVEQFTEEQRAELKYVVSPNNLVLYRTT